jgi:hypothetical protein
MPITVQWDNDEQRVMRYTFEGRWTWDEYHHAIDEAFGLVKDLPYIVNMMLDFSSSNLFPSNALTHFSSSMKTPPRDFDAVVVVSGSRFVDTLVSILSRVSSKIGEKLIVVKSLDEGRTYLATLEKRIIGPSIAKS